MLTSAGRVIQEAVASLGPSAVRGRLVYRLPVEAVLTGIYANPSGFNKGASYIEAFAQPLYVPAEHLVLGIGHRLGGGSRTYTLDEVASGAVDLEGAVSFLDTHRDPAALLQSGGLSSRADIRALEAEACSLTWCGRLDEARSALESVAGLSLTYDWEHDVAERIHRLQSLLESSPDQAMQQLEQWRDESIAALGLPTTAMHTPD